MTSQNIAFLPSVDRLVDLPWTRDRSLLVDRFVLDCDRREAESKGGVQ